MRILPSSEKRVEPMPDSKPEAPAIRLPIPMEVVAPPAPTVDPERVTVLETMVKSLLEKVHALEDRLQALEKQPPATTPPASVPSGEGKPPVTIDAAAIKKGVLDQMWKHLKDGR